MTIKLGSTKSICTKYLGGVLVSEEPYGLFVLSEDFKIVQIHADGN
jgi:hypothetical protein